jgi:hypothetical protein
MGKGVYQFCPKSKHQIVYNVITEATEFSLPGPSSLDPPVCHQLSVTIGKAKLRQILNLPKLQGAVTG